MSWLSAHLFGLVEVADKRRDPPRPFLLTFQKFNLIDKLAAK